MKKLLLLAIVVLGISAVSFGQTTLTATTTADLLTPISIGLGENMDFGTVAASGTEGTIKLGFDNTREETGGASALATREGKCAVFNVEGSGTENIVVSYTTGSIDLDGPSTGVKVGSFEANCGTGVEALVGGKLEIIIKAILTVPADALAGTYTNANELFVTVNYQ